MELINYNIDEKVSRRVPGRNQKIVLQLDVKPSELFVERASFYSKEEDILYFILKVSDSDQTVTITPWKAEQTVKLQSGNVLEYSIQGPRLYI